MTKKHLATITIAVKNRQKNITALNNLLTKNGNMIIARFGINIKENCATNYSGLITITIENTILEINKLTKKLNSLNEITAKCNIM